MKPIQFSSIYHLNFSKKGTYEERKAVASKIIEDRYPDAHLVAEPDYSGTFAVLGVPPWHDSEEASDFFIAVDDEEGSHASISKALRESYTQQINQAYMDAVAGTNELQKWQSERMNAGEGELKKPSFSEAEYMEAHNQYAGKHFLKAGKLTDEMKEAQKTFVRAHPNKQLQVDYQLHGDGRIDYTL
jgi:hypothetical protein